MSKITKSTLKSFINKNVAALFINVKSKFNGDCDGVISTAGGFSLAQKDESNASYTLGVKGAWFVGNSRDFFTAYEDGQFSGYEVFNSCGSFVLAVKMPDKDFLIDSDSALRALGVVNITNIGSENIYFEKDGYSYYAKVYVTERFNVGRHDFSDDFMFSNRLFCFSHKYAERRFLN
jgi:hypothetical protein